MEVTPLIRAALRGPARAIRQAVLPRLIPPSRGRIIGEIDLVRVVGLLSSSSGVGKSARLCIEALERAGVNVSTADVSDLFAASDGLPYPSRRQAPSKQLVTIYHLNPPKLLPGILRSGVRLYRRSFNVGYWAWELGILPPEWVVGIRFVDAVLVPSTFCRDTVKQYTNKPVIVVPHPLSAPVRKAVAQRQGIFRVLSIFSFDSSFERKNPVAVVRAFKLAFGADLGAELVLKTSGGGRNSEQLACLRREIGYAPNIKVFDEIWASERLEEMLSKTQVYVSLHRSEGFGLTIAEAALMEVPVVLTNWSGNIDFCPPDLCFPVEYELIQCRDSHLDFADSTGALWAEASIRSAAAQLIAIRADPAAARKKAAGLRRAVERHIATYTYPAALALLVLECQATVGGAEGLAA